MNSTGQNREKSGYKVLLLLVVGLTAFSSAMKDLNHLRQFTLDASELIAEWSDKFSPAPEVPAVPQTIEVHQTAIKVETCELKQSEPSVELPWLSNVVAPRPVETKPRAITPRPSQVIDFKNDVPLPGEIQIAKLKKIPQFDFDSAPFVFRIVNGDEPDVVLTTETKSDVKTRARRYREIRINPRDREMLKNLNRSINLRFAS
jgi:hypothetical protein